MNDDPVLPLRPRRLAPEVIQTSAMDCGPATLKSLLDGCGLSVHYGRLREACQTGLDGTSIDTLEDLANALGLVATQTLVPVDHVGLRAEGRTPALTIVNLPGGRGTHFVVVWAGYGRFVQVMDPSSGRRFRPAHALRAQLYVHAHQAAPETFRTFASSASFLAPFEERLRALSIAASGRRALLRSAQEDDEASGLAALDAATRLVATLVAARHVGGGRRVQALVHTFTERVRAEPAQALQVIPPRFWFARPDGPNGFLMRGAVLVQAQGLRASAQVARPRTAAPAPTSPLRELLTTAPSRPLATVHRLLREEGAFPRFALAAIVATSSAALLAESALLRGLVDLGQRLGTPAARAGGVAALACFLLALFALVAGATQLSLRLGRRLEARLRMVYFAKLPRLGDRYFQSRLVADMAERGHMLVLLRRLPELVVTMLRGSIDVVLYAVGLVWLDPSSAWLVALTALFAGCAPLLLQPLLAEAEMRVRGQQAALGRFYLDALLGLVPLRMHAAERALAREQEGVLDQWFSAGLRLQGLSVGADGLVALGTTALSGLLVLHQLTRDGSLGAALLVVYWSLQLPAQAAASALALRQYPAFRNVLMRMLELADAPEEVSVAPSPTAPATGRGMALALERLSVVASGQTVLRELDLQIAPGEHVAIVGRSGAGKSSLVGLFLGWQRPAAGRVLVDGQPLDGARLAGLRREVAWVDPAVQLWNDSLLANVQYGAAPPAPDALARLLEESELANVVERLPEGLGSGVGEGGGLLSGGEGQRVRLCRGLLRPEARLVVLDEALRGLARGQRALLLARVRARAEGATLLCVTHDLAETVSFPRVLVVEDGRIVEDGAPRVLLARTESRYAQLLRGDELAHERVWRAPFWRRWQVAGGRFVEER